MILVAKCRTGVPCRYHGRSVESPTLSKKLKRKKYMLICPEVEFGLPIPRSPIIPKKKKLFYENKDITNPLRKLCEKILTRFKNIEYFIGVNGSPCCDPKNGCFSKVLRKKGIKTRVSI